MADDSFEVKLRDNYELLEDEYNEGLKRQNMLKDKVSLLQKLGLVVKLFFFGKSLQGR